MFKKSTATLITSMALVLVLAMAAFAQVPPPQGPNGPRGQRGQNGQLQHRAGGGQNGAQGMWAQGTGENKGAFANLQRILLPPSMREMEKTSLALNLTDDQKTKIKDLYKVFGGVMKQLAPQRAAAIKAVMQAMQQANPSKSDLEAAAAKVAQLDTAITGAEFDFWINLKVVMNPQQQSQLQGFMMQRAEREISGGPRPNPGPATAPPATK